MRQLRQGRSRDWALARLTTLGEACQAMLREILRTTLTWALRQVTEEGQDARRVLAELGLA